VVAQELLVNQIKLLQETQNMAAVVVVVLAPLKVVARPLLEDLQFLVLGRVVAVR